MTAPDTLPNPPPHDDDARWLAAFLAAELPASAFDHAGHLRAAGLLLSRHPLAEARPLYLASLRRLATRLGVPAKVNATVTEALLLLMAAAGAGTPGEPWERCLQREPALRGDAWGLLTRHYSPDRLRSDAARQHFVAPDRLPLPPCPVPPPPRP